MFHALHNSQSLETTQVLKDRLIKETMVHIHNVYVSQPHEKVQSCNLLLQRMYVGVSC